MTEKEFENQGIIENADKIDVLLNSDGWALVVEKIKARLKNHQLALESCREDELKGIQARVKEIKMIRAIPQDFLKARKRIKEEEIENGK